MSSSIASPNSTPHATTAPGGNSLTSQSGSRSQQVLQQQNPSATGIPSMNAQFREIHKNTWLKRLTAEGKKICVGPKKSDRSWVVFCVHDDTEALLEGYVEPRQAPSHSPEWVVSMQDTLHISHALIPNSHEFEFVVTLCNEVLRFHAMSWDIMQEWVETLRSKLREMKILSPRENLYTKLPEIRAPLLPTRDPTSPLPAPPPVPAAIVPGVERVIPLSIQEQVQQEPLGIDNHELGNAPNNESASSLHTMSDSNAIDITTITSNITTANSTAQTFSSAPSGYVTPAATHLTSMSNTLTQNLLNMLSDPISAYSEQLNDANSSSSSVEPDNTVIGTLSLSLVLEKELNLSDTALEEEYIAPLLRNPSEIAYPINEGIDNNSVRLDVLSAHRTSEDQLVNLESILEHDGRVSRHQTSCSLSAGIVEKSKRQNANKKVEPDEQLSPIIVTNNSNKIKNITELEINPKMAAPSSSNTSNSNITIIQVSTENVNEKAPNSSAECDNEKANLPQKKPSIADVFKFPDAHVSVTKNIKQHEYKSNVQIIPSSSNNCSNSINHNLNSSSSIHVAAKTMTAVGVNQYTTPVKRSQMASCNSVVPSSISSEQNKVTTVHVSGSDNTYGTCFTPPLTPVAALYTSTPKMPKKIILSTNTSGITNIAVNNSTPNERITADTTIVLRQDSVEFATTSNTTLNKHNGLHYEKCFLSTSPVNASSQPTANLIQHKTPQSPKQNSGHHARIKLQPKENLITSPLPTTNSADKKVKAENVTAKYRSCDQRHNSPAQIQPSVADQSGSSIIMSSPAMARRICISSTESAPLQPSPPPRAPFILTRGLTEAVITSRPSRKDFHVANKLSAKTKTSNNSKFSNTSNNNENSAVSFTATSSIPSHIATPTHLAINRGTSEALELRKRSSSTSDAHSQRHTRATNNNDSSNRANMGVFVPLRQPPQPFRLTDNVLNVNPSPCNLPSHNITSPAKRMTLREQQVMQIRREIMHSGGVRLQLRRKDCVGSIAWVEVFGAVWIAGWKQREHPVLYNALHIGDQLLSIAGITINSAAEANKIIRNTNTLFVEVLVRRIPFGRGYAIRREREGQCLGLIRDGHTATIVDVVPNSLAARHGLPPKAQSCDGTTLTFWVLTEINGRPLNLFSKDNEIRDRLNSVGRDISILVQPSDLITKLKKQLKSLRGYKDYLVL